MINSTKEWDWMDNNDLNKDGTFMDVRQEERNNLILIIQLIIGVSIASACACLLYTSPSPRDRTRSRMPSSA